MAKQTELELTAQQAAQPEETPAKKTAAKKTAAKKPAAKKATTKKTTTKTKAAKAEDGETAAKKPAAKRTTKKTEAKPGTKLVIVESPAKAKTIGKYLGRGYTVTASMGHIRDLPASTLGIDVEHGYTPKYITIKGKTALVKDLKAEAKKAQTVYLATDPDREGEAISWHLANVLGLDPTAPNRVTFDEITKKGVQEGMAHPRTIAWWVISLARFCGIRCAAGFRLAACRAWRCALSATARSKLKTLSPKNTGTLTPT